MQRECFRRPDRCCKIAIGRGPSDIGPRFGGRPPEGISPENRPLRYLFTVPWSNEADLSVFVDTDPDFIYGEGVTLPCGSPHFEVVFHGERGRGGHCPNDSELSEHPLVIGQEVDDVGPVDEDGIQRPYSGHKLGGRPYFVHGDLQLESAVGNLLKGGFVHAVQMDFPADPGAAVSGPWPFGTGIFHVLVRERTEGVDAHCFWEM